MQMLSLALPTSDLKRSQQRLEGAGTLVFVRKSRHGAALSNGSMQLDVSGGGEGEGCGPLLGGVPGGSGGNAGRGGRLGSGGNGGRGGKFQRGGSSESAAAVARKKRMKMSAIF